MIELLGEEGLSKKSRSQIQKWNIAIKCYVVNKESLQQKRCCEKPMKLLNGDV